MASVLSIAVLATATPASARISVGATLTASESPTAAEEAQTLFKEGVTLYRMSDYQGSLAQFKKAFKISIRIEDDGLRARVLHALQFNLARAHIKTYGIDQDAQHLRTALDLLDKYLSAEEGLTIDPGAEKLRAEAQSLLDASRKGTPATPAPNPIESTEDGPTDAEADADAVDDAPMDDGAAADPSAKVLKISGYAALGVAAVGLGLLGGGMAMGSSAKTEYATAGTTADYDAALKKGNTGNALTVAGAVTAGVFASAGVALLVVGARKSRTDRRGATLRAAPLWSTHTAGVVLGGAF